MNKSGDPDTDRRLAQGCVYDDWFDGTSLSYEHGYARGIGKRLRLP